MPKVFFPSFGAGEISDSLYGRLDLGKYNVGAKLIRNMVVLPEGGAENRAGTRFVTEVHDSTKIHRLVSFQFSTVQAYALELGDNTLRVIKDGGIVLDGPSPYLVATPWGENDLAGLAFTQSADVMYVVHPDYPPYTISRLADDNWVIEAFDSVGPFADQDIESIVLSFDARKGSAVTITASSGFFESYHVGTSLFVGYYGSLAPSEIQWYEVRITGVTDSLTATGDTGVIALGYIINLNPYFATALNFWADNSTAGANISLKSAGVMRMLSNTGTAKAYQNEIAVPKNSDLTFHISALIGPGPTIAPTLTISVGTSPGASDIASLSINSLTAVDQGLDFNSGVNDTVFLSITFVGNEPISVTADVETAVLLEGGSDSSIWRESAWNSNTGYPRAITIFDQRLVFAGTVEKPQTLWLSKVGGYNDFTFSTPGADDDAFALTIAARKVNAIQWLQPTKVLLIGTSGTEWALSGVSGGPLTPNSFDIQNQSFSGSNQIPPVVSGNVSMFVQRGSRTVRDLGYSFASDTYEGKEMTVLAKHLFSDRSIVAWDIQTLPEAIIWAVLSDGALVGMTYQKEHEVFAWHRHDTGLGLFKSVVNVPNGEQDDAYFIVERVIDGNTVKYIEQLGPRIEDEDTFDFYMLDSELSYHDADNPITSVSGLDHLEGVSVGILADGSVVPNQVVTGGVITLPIASGVIHVGIPIVSDLVTVEPELQDDIGTSQGREKTISSVIVRFKKSRAAFVGPYNKDLANGDTTGLEEIKLRTPAMGAAPIPLLTEDKEQVIDFPYEKEGVIRIRNIYPVPLTILAIIPNVELGGELA